MKARRPVYRPPASAGPRNTPWPVPSYLPRPGAASSVLSTLRDIVIPLARQFVDRIIRYVFPTAGTHRARVGKPRPGSLGGPTEIPRTRRFAEAPWCNHPGVLAYLSL